MVSATAGPGQERVLHSQPQRSQLAQYEMAGVSHIPEPIVALGLPNQNSADAATVVPRRFQESGRWRALQTPQQAAASRHFEGDVDANGVFIPTKDADGHFAGGVRLPHVESFVQRTRGGSAARQSHADQRSGP